MRPLSILLFPALASAHTCVHDALDHTHPNVNHVIDVEYNGGARNLQETQYESLRIKFEFVDVSGMNDEQRIHMEQTILPEAVNYWQDTLKVERATAPFHIDPCVSSWVFGDGTMLCYSVAETPMCGEVAVPAKYIQETTYCDGCRPNDHCCFSADNCGTCQTTSAAEGVDDADFIIFVNAVETASCSGSTLAYAGPCMRDPNGRPIGGYMNVCPTDFYKDKSDQQQLNDVKVFMHELSHALGFSSSSWHLFRDQNGNQRSSQESVSYTCNGERSFIPALNTVEAFSERGYDANQCPYPTGKQNGGAITNDPAGGRCLLKMTTEAVVREAKAYFNCDSANGIELENHLSSTCSMVGSHVEQRLLNFDLMASYPLEYDGMQVSPVTLAVFEDSGWYQVDYATGVRQESATVWGKDQGCDFLSNKCINDQGNAIGDEHYCTTSNEEKCAVGRLSKAVCSMTTYSSDILPAQLRYFSNAKLGGSLANIDYCPFYRHYSNGNCVRPSSETNQEQNYGGEITGSSSLCFDGNLVWDNLVESDQNQARCYSVSNCILDAADNSTFVAYSVNVYNSQSDTQYAVTCTASDVGQSKSVQSFKGGITCADPDEICHSEIDYEHNLNFTNPSTSPTPLTPSPVGDPTSSPALDNSSTHNAAISWPLIQALMVVVVWKSL